MKKLTYEYVKSEIEKIEGYKLLSDEYVNACTKLKIKHKCGNEYKVVFFSFQRGQRCPVCNKQKLSFDYVKNEIEKVEGYKLLSDEYVNARKKLKVKHEKCGTIYHVTFGHFKCDGSRCPKCQKVQKYNYNEVKNIIENGNNNEYKLLSTEYINIGSKLKILHEKCGTIYHVTFDSFNGKHSRCPKCNGVIKLTFEEIKQIIEDNKYTLLSNKYINAKNYLILKCPNGHVYETKWNTFQQGSRCNIKECCRHPNIKHTYEYIKSEIEKISEYELISDIYINSKTKITLKHKKCNLIYDVLFNSFQQGHKCPKCQHDKQSSKWEKEVACFIKEIVDPYEVVETNNRDQVFNYTTGCFLELDIFLKEKNKAVECNDEYYHGMLYQQEKDKMKVIQCKEKGIDLLVIYERDWKYKRENCKQQIREFLNDKFCIAR